MVKKSFKYFSSILASIIVFNMTTFVHAAEKKSSTVSISTVKIEQLARQSLNEEEKSKIDKDYKYLTDCGLDVNEISDIGVNKNNENEYKFSYPNNIKETVTIKCTDGVYTMDVKTDKKHDKIVFDEGDIYLDGNKIEVEESTVVLNESSNENKIEAEESTVVLNESSNENIIPMADRASWNTAHCPYGKPSDYNNMVATRKDSNVPLHKMIKDITTTTLMAIIGGIGIIEGISSTVAGFIVSQFSQSSSKGLSYKNFIYYHKSGHYIKKLQGQAQKNNVRWYEKINYKGKSAVKATYSVQKFY